MAKVFQMPHLHYMSQTMFSLSGIVWLDLRENSSRHSQLITVDLFHIQHNGLILIVQLSSSEVWESKMSKYPRGLKSLGEKQLIYSCNKFSWLCLKKHSFKFKIIISKQEPLLSESKMMLLPLSVIIFAHVSVCRLKFLLSTFCHSFKTKSPKPGTALLWTNIFM